MKYQITLIHKKKQSKGQVHKKMINKFLECTVELPLKLAQQLIYRLVLD